MREGHNLGRVEVIRESDKAILVGHGEHLDDPVWIPKSVIHDDSEVWDGSTDGCGPGDLIVETWFAEKEGWL